MAQAAASAGVHTAIGLQLRASPAVQAARRQIADGEIGRVLSVSAFSSTAGFGPGVTAPFVYLEDPASFANLVTIQGAHTLDLVIALGGQATGIAALASRQFPHIRLGDDGTAAERATADHLLAQGHVADGVPFTLEVAGDRTGETPFHLDIVGERGSLRLDGGAVRGLQSGRIGFIQNGQRVATDEGELAGLSDAAVNVAGLYAMLRDDIRAGTRNLCGFDHAVRLTRLVEDLFRSSDGGHRISGGDWPRA